MSIFWQGDPNEIQTFSIFFEFQFESSAPVLGRHRAGRDCRRSGCLSRTAPRPGRHSGTQRGLEEIIVTAQRREESLQDVPIAVAALTAESLEIHGVDSTRDLPQVVPSVQFTRSGASGLIFIRGVGTTNAAVGEEGSNAVYVDNVYFRISRRPSTTSTTSSGSKCSRARKARCSAAMRPAA